MSYESISNLDNIALGTLAVIYRNKLQPIARMALVTPFVVNFATAATKVVRNRELFKALYQDGVQLSRIFDLSLCPNITSLSLETLEVIAKSELSSLEIAVLTQTQECVDIINNNITLSDIKKIKLVFVNESSISLIKFPYPWFDVRKIINGVKSIDATKFDILLNNTKLSSGKSYGFLLSNQNVVNGLNSVDTEKLNLVLADEKFNIFNLISLLENQNAVNGLNLINAGRIKTIVSKTDSYNFEAILCRYGPGLKRNLGFAVALIKAGMINSIDIGYLYNNHIISNDVSSCISYSHICMKRIVERVFLVDDPEPVTRFMYKTGHNEYSSATIRFYFGIANCEKHELCCIYKS